MSQNNPLITLELDEDSGHAIVHYGSQRFVISQTHEVTILDLVVLLVMNQDGIDVDHMTGADIAELAEDLLPSLVASAAASELGGDDVH